MKRNVAYECAMSPPSPSRPLHRGRPEPTMHRGGQGPSSFESRPGNEPDATHPETGVTFMTRAMEFRILGPLEVRDGDRMIPVARGRQRALFALLILSANETVSTERLVEELWSGSPPAT